MASLETAPPRPSVPGFAVHERIAVGGQGSIWSAHRDDGTEACIKIARPIGAAKIAAWSREVELQRRAGTLAPEVFGDGITGDGDRWLAMARIEDDTLATIVAAEPGPWSCARVADVLAPLSASIAALHRCGIVHGDLKPENIFVANGRAVLVDFGSASAQDDSVPAADCAGTATYLAPERTGATACSTATGDLYALAVLAFELLTGVPPFWGPDEIVIESHRSRRPPALVRWRLPAALDRLLARALAKDPRARPSDVASFAADLLACLRANADVVATPPTTEADLARRSGRKRSRAPLLWWRTDLATAQVYALVARHHGVLAHARKGWMVAAFVPHGASTPMPAALAAARSLLADGATDRVLVDIDVVGVREDGDTPRVFSPQFAFASRYPDDADPAGVSFTKVAAEAMHELPMLPMAHRDDRLVCADEDAWALARATESASTLHGRAELLATLSTAALEASTGRPTLATITGEPGSGRTRVAAAFAEALASEPAWRVVTLAAPDGGSSSCSSLAVRRLLGLDDTRPADPRGVLAAKLASPEVPIGLLLALDWAEPGDPSVEAMRAAPGAIRTSIALAIAELLRQLAAIQPLVLVVDDADRAEPAWLDAVEAATLAEHGAALLVCMLGRSQLASDRPAWSTRAARSLPLELRPLELSTTAELVRELLQPARNVPDAAVEVIHHRTRGLPLLIVELARVLRSAGALQRVPGGTGWAFAADVLQRVPDLPLASWMAQRELDRLPSALARHAAVVAAMGPNSEPSALEATLQRLDVDGSELPTELEPEIAAARLLAAGVLRRDGAALAFRHTALREQAASLLDETAAKRLHTAAHAVLAGLVDPTRMQRAARLHHALGAGLVADAGADALALAVDASRRHAYLEAESCYAIAITHVAADSDAAIAAAHGRGLMRFRLGRHEQARTDLARVIAGADGPRRIEALLDAATVEDWCEDFDRAEALVGEVQAIGVGDSAHEQARLALARGRAAFRRGRIEESIALLTDAVAAAEALGDAAYETHVIALVLLAPLLGMTGHADRSLPLFDRLFVLCREHADRIHLATAFLNRPFVWIELGRYEQLHEDLEQVIALSRAAGFPLLECRARYNLGEIAYLLGEYADGERHAAEVIELEHQLGGGDQRILVTLLLAARCRARAGELAEATALTRQIRAQQAEARLAGASGFELMSSDEILCRMVELTGTDAGEAAWAELVDASERESVQQEHIEVLELAGLAAARRGDLVAARTWLQRALAATETTPTMLRPRVEAALAAAGAAARVQAS